MAITYRPTPEIDTVIDDLKDQLGIPTTSKLITFLIASYNRNQDIIKSQRDEIKALKNQVYESGEVVSEFQEAFTRLMEYK
ncbi:hypothetical protein [Pseudoalteromonas piscicida]|uniref:hypothetical protein n=1 Tax=Pseudoalteromonas piscicida TaxID=43662 RepID=UPI000E35ED24|nr:hypothetical protein [Pseudoalteromonas piscicida]AXQ97957.1 hypothetical protein D0N37_09460 [Pseudoalteromonas piscicida]